MLRKYEYMTTGDMHAQQVPPPAMAFVRATGELYFTHPAQYWGGQGGFRWVRAQDSGGSADILAVNTTDLTGQYLSDLYALILSGPDAPSPRIIQKYGGGYQQIIYRLLGLVRSTFYAESNRPSEADPTVPMLDLESGDVAVDRGNRARFIQAPLSTIPTYEGQKLYRIGTDPIKRGTPGIHIQEAAERRPSPISFHPERIGYIIPSQDIPQGATTFRCSVWPESLPSGEYGGGKEWIVRNDQNDGEPNTQIDAPGFQQPGVWNTRKEVYLEAPYSYVDIQATFTPLQLGTLPTTLNTTITLDRRCPMPLYFGGSLFEYTMQEYFLDPPKLSVGWEPLGTYGGHLGSLTIPARITGQGEEKVEAGSENGGLDVGDTDIRLYRPWINKIGLREFSGLRGIRVNDFISVSNNPQVYRVIGVKENQLNNPSSLKITPPIAYEAKGAIQNNDGIWVSTYEIHRIPSFPQGSLIWRCLGWPFPNGNTAIPLMVKKISNGFVTLHAPVPQAIPAGTRLNVWPMKDLETCTYAYHDDATFFQELDQYNELEFKFTRERLQTRIEQLSRTLVGLKNNKEQAIEAASKFWFSPPYYVNKEINQWLQERYKKYGSTFLEAELTLLARQRALGQLAATSTPNVTATEYYNLINYGRGQIGAP